MFNQNHRHQLRKLRTERSQTEQQNQEQQNSAINIIGQSDGSCNQMILIYLFPFTMVWHKGCIISSNHSVVKQKRRENIIDLATNSFKVGSLAPGSLQNLSSDTCYYILKKSTGQDGKIIVLNENVYKDHFYIDYSKLLTINLDVHQYDLLKHPKIRYLKGIIPKREIPVPLVFTLQSTRDSIITQKYLAANEKLYLPNAKIIATSMKTLIRRTDKNKQLYITGPGFVFFEAESQINIHPQYYEYAQLFVFAIALMFIVDYF